jgi:hypothetical protein
MIHTMQRLLVLILLTSLSAPVMAQDEETRPDARTEGFVRGEGQSQPLLITPEKGASTAWVILIALGVVSVGVMFKNGKRTHLD